MNTTFKNTLGAMLLAGTSLAAAGSVVAQQAAPSANTGDAHMSERGDHGAKGGPGRGKHHNGAMWDFTRFDTDGDGQVSKEEIAKIRADKVTALDANGDGLLSEEELVAAEMADAQARIEKRVAARIAMSDADGDGMLSAAELAVKPSLPLAMFDRIDADGDGVITQEEVNAMKETMQKRGFEGHHNKDRTHPERGADKADGPQ